MRFLHPRHPLVWLSIVLSSHLSSPPARSAGWTVGSAGTILKSTDAGATWSLTNPTTNDLRALWLIDDVTGWAVGSTGAIFKTTNGGSSWTAQTSGTNAVLNGVHFASSTTGWAVGTTGTILKTTNGGSSWTAQTSGSSAILNGVFFVDTSTGWAVGTGGTILKTTNGGSSWSGTFPTTAILNSVHFVSSTTGWAVGTTGTILKTTNGGTSWTGSFPTSTTLNSVHFVSSTTGWAVGGAGTILKTTNAGSSWTSLNPSTAELKSVRFVSSTTGWAVGTGGAIFKTTDTGATWTGTFPTTATLYGVSFASIPVNISVTVNTSPTGRSFTVDGTTYTSSRTFTWLSGSSHTIATTSPQAGGTGTQYVWTGWSDGGGISHTVAPSTAVTYTASFKTQYLLTMSAGAGGTVSPATGYRDAAGAVSVTATPNSGFAFSGWSGSGSGSYTGSNNPASVTMNGPITETASFTATIPVTVGTSPAGRSFTVDGTTYTASQTFTWVSGSSHTIATTSPQAGGTGTQHVWTGWSDGGAISHTVAPTSGVTYTASFKTQHLLTMNAGAGGTVSPSSGYRDAGSAVTITATPSSGFSFDAWAGSGTGSYTGSNNPASVTVSAPITQTAAFAASAAVTVDTSPSGLEITVDGAAYTAPQAFSWTPGSVHTIATDSSQAGPAGTQYRWSAWSDAGAISHTVAPAGAATYVAQFQTQHWLNMSAGAGGTVTPASSWQDEGAVVLIRAVPDPGYAFAAWTGAGAGSYSGTADSTTVTMSAPIDEAAAFVPDVTGVEDFLPAVPASLFLAPARPNPVAHGTAIRFGLPSAGRVSLRVFDVQGRVVAALVDGALPAGTHDARWDTRAAGRPLPSGVYFVRLEQGTDVRTQRLVVIR
jgi:photosystem II stability/assembly factor-like uncharacterized protein